MNRNMTLKIYFILFFTILVISCKKSEKNYLERFDKEYTVKHSTIRLAKNEVFYQVYKIHFINNQIIALDIDNKNCLSIINLNKKRITSRFCKRGQGPNEVIGFPGNLTKIASNTVRFYVANNYTFFDTDISNPLNPGVTSETKFMFNAGTIGAVSLCKGYTLAIGGLEKGQYSLIDSTGFQLSVFSEYPHFEGDEKFTNFHKSLAFQGDFTRHPSGEKVCFVTSKSHLIDIITFDAAKKTLSKAFNWQGELGTFVPEGDGTITYAAAIKRETKTAFLDISSTENYIYLLYSGRIIGNEPEKAFKGNTVFVLDWEGNPLARYNLDIDVKCITVSDDDKTLYAIAEQDDTELVKFKLMH